jgi:hypothetical protein
MGFSSSLQTMAQQFRTPQQRPFRSHAKSPPPWQRAVADEARARASSGNSFQRLVTAVQSSSGVCTWLPFEIPCWRETCFSKAGKTQPPFALRTGELDGWKFNTHPRRSNASTRNSFKGPPTCGPAESFWHRTMARFPVTVPTLTAI